MAFPDTPKPLGMKGWGLRGSRSPETPKNPLIKEHTSGFLKGFLKGVYRGLLNVWDVL